MNPKTKAPKNIIAFSQALTVVENETPAEVALAIYLRAQELARLQIGAGNLRVTFHIPASVYADFKAFWNHNRENSGRWGKSTPPDPETNGYEWYIQESLMIGTHTPDDYRWDKPFNKPCAYMIPSRKKRLAEIYRAANSGKMVSETILIGAQFWQRIQAYAAHQGITPQEQILLCMDYHGEIWRKDYKPKPPAAFNSFEKGLARESKAQRGKLVTA